MRPHVPDKKHNNHIAAKYMALHVPETLHVKALRLLCCTLYDTARRYLYRPTTLKRGKSSRKKNGY